MSCKDREMFESTAQRLPLEQKSDTPTNSQGKTVHCDDYASAEVEGGKRILTKIEGGESNMVPKGKACEGEPVS